MQMSFGFLRTVGLVVFLLLVPFAVAAADDILRLRAECAALTDNADHRGALRVAGQLRREATAAGDMAGQAYGIYYEGVSDILLGNTVRGKASLDRALAVAQQMGNDTILHYIYNALGIYEAGRSNLTLASDHFYRALRYAMNIGDMKRRAKIEINLAHILYDRRDTTGIKFVREVYAQARKDCDPDIAIPAGYYYACFLCLQGDYDGATQRLDEVMGLAEKSHYKEISSLYKLQAEICYHRGELSSARYALDRALAAQSDAQAATLPEIYLGMAQVAAAEGKYDESNRLAALGRKLAGNGAFCNLMADFYALEAANYEKRGDATAALESLKKYGEITDSIYHVDKERTINELTIKYNVDKRESELAYNREMLAKESQKNTILIVSILILLLAAGTLAVMYRRQLSLYRAIVKQNRNALALRGLLPPSSCSDDDIGSMPDMGNDDTPSDSDADTDKADLYSRVCRLLESDKVYTDSTLTRDSLARMVGSNRTYLSVAINKNAGMSFSQFINSYRIQEAVRMLSDPSNSDYPLKALAADLGFSSISTFYKQFQMEVGLTPSAYRKTMLSL